MRKLIAALSFAFSVTFAFADESAVAVAETSAPAAAEAAVPDLSDMEAATLLAPVNDRALAKVMRAMGKDILFDGKVDLRETEVLLDFFRGLDGREAEEFRATLERVRADGVITDEESAEIAALVKKYAD